MQGRYDVLDGVRGVAILVVLVFHFMTWPVGGFLGVDLFFVLSGFLITNRLLRDSGAFGGRQLGYFYYGRLLRIVPAMAEMILLYGAIRLAYPEQVTQFRENVLSAVFLVANWTRAFGLPYPDYLGHAWSLSVEEQYYLLWPLLVLVTLKAARNERALAWVLGLMIAVLWAVRFALANDPATTVNRLYNGTDTRVSSILMGCLVAVLFRDGKVRAALERSRGGASVMAGLAGVVVIGSAATFDWRDRPLFLWGLSLFSTACGVLILYLITFRESRVARALSWGPLVWVGKRSYGLYLFHFPIFMWLLLILKVPASWKLAALAGPPTVLLAALSWRWVEEPSMALRRR